MTDEKPPIGVKPYYVAAEHRIIELAEAIARAAEYSTKNPKIIEWAREIILQATLSNQMDTGGN